MRSTSQNKMKQIFVHTWIELNRLATFLASTFFVILLSLPVPGVAGDWTMNLGYNNPPGANVGLNFMHLWTNWAFEFGVGSVSTQKTDSTTGEKTTSVIVGGDLNLKYLFGSGLFRPYLQGGVGAAAGSTSNTAGVGLGGGFGGAGIFLLGRDLYVYGSLMFSSGTYYQAGIGFDI